MGYGRIIFQIFRRSLTSPFVGASAGIHAPLEDQPISTCSSCYLAHLLARIGALDRAKVLTLHRALYKFVHF